MTQTYNEEVVIDGSADETQLTVQGHSTQNEPLQTWEDSAGDPLAKVTGDGRLQVGSFDAQGAMATDDSLIEVYRDPTDTAKPTRGLHVAGEVADDDSDALAWSVHELTLSGDQTTTGKATALSAKVTTDDADIDTAVGIEAAVDKEGTGTIDEAVGVEVADINQGTANYAIRTGDGTIRFGDLDAGTVQSDTDGDLSVRKDKVDSTAPDADNDSSEGYQVGSRWIDTANDKEYVCVDATEESAIWVETTGAATTTLDVTTETHRISKELYSYTINAQDQIDDKDEFIIDNIDQSYDDLEIILSGSSENATQAVIYVYFNDDETAANYYRQILQGQDTTANASEGAGAAIGTIGPDPTTTGYLRGWLRAFIPEYSGNDYKVIIARNDTRKTTAQIQHRNTAVQWENNAPITKIRIYTADPFVAGTNLRVIGHKNAQVVTSVSGDVFAAIGDQDEGSLLTWDGNQEPTILPPGTPGQVLAINSVTGDPGWETPIAGNSTAELTVTKSNYRVSEELAFVQLSADGDFDISNIDQSYDDLEIHLVVRATVAAVGDNGYIYFNGDTTNANYRRQRFQGTNTSPSTGEADDALCVYSEGSTAPSDHWASVHIRILDYTNPNNYKKVFSTSHARPAAGQTVIRFCAVDWENKLPINRIQITDSADSNPTIFAAGSYMRVIGHKNAEVVTDISGDVYTAIGNQNEGSLLTWDSNEEAVILAPGASGQVLTSNGPNLQPTWQNPAIWLRCDGRTFGDDSSGATIEDADLFDLFEHLWLEFTDDELPMYTDSTKTTQVNRGVGGNDQEDDWNAGYCMTLPDLRGRVAMMMDDPTGSNAASRVTGSWADAMGGSGGAETHTLGTTEMPSHKHSYRLEYGGSSGNGLQAGSATYQTHSGYMNNTGDGGAHNNIQPSIAAGNYFIYTGN
jgi:hypothetical protein